MSASSSNRIVIPIQRSSHCASLNPASIPLTQFDSTYPQQLSGIITPTEYSASIHRINRHLKWSTTNHRIQCIGKLLVVIGIIGTIGTGIIAQERYQHQYTTNIIHHHPYGSGQQLPLSPFVSTTGSLSVSVSRIPDTNVGMNEYRSATGIAAAVGEISLPFQLPNQPIQSSQGEKQSELKGQDQQQEYVAVNQQPVAVQQEADSVERRNWFYEADTDMNSNRLPITQEMIQPRSEAQQQKQIQEFHSLAQNETAGEKRAGSAPAMPGIRGNGFNRVSRQTTRLQEQRFRQRKRDQVQMRSMKPDNTNSMSVSDSVDPDIHLCIRQMFIASFFVFILGVLFLVHIKHAKLLSLITSIVPAVCAEQYRYNKREDRVVDVNWSLDEKSVATYGYSDSGLKLILDLGSPGDMKEVWCCFDGFG